MAHIVPLRMDHMTCGVLCTISGAACEPPTLVCTSRGVCVCVLRRCCSLLLLVGFGREVQVMETQGGAGSTEGGGGDGQSGQAASTALIEKILSEEPRWQGIIEVSSTIPQKVVVTLLLFVYEMHPQCPQSLCLLA